jgi:hypothetical protein
MRPGLLAEGADRQFAQVFGQMRGLDAGAGGERDAALDDVFQFAHVAGKVVGAQQFERVGGEFGDVLAHQRAHACAGSGRPAAARLPGARRARDVQVDDVEAEVEVLAEAAALHHVLHVAVGGGDEAHVDFHRRGGAERQHLLFLDHAQQLDLHGRRHFGDLVEEQRAAVGRLEQALLVGVGAGEGALGVAEQLVGQQLLVEGAAVHRDEGPPGRAGCDGAGSGRRAPCRCRIRR